MTNSIPILKPKVPVAKELIKYIEKIDRNRNYSNWGELVLLLEKRISAYLSLPPDNIVALSSATLGLQGAIASQELRNWICPSWSFAATGQALNQSKVNFIFEDVDFRDWHITECVNKVNDKSNQGILSVAPFGDYPKLDKYNSEFKLIYDVAASFGALKDIGTDKHLRDNQSFVLSLHATKLLPAGEGGIFFSTNKSAVDYVRNWANFGFRKNSRLSESQGTNAKMSEYAAAVALSAFDQWENTKLEYQELLKWAKSVSRLNQLGVHPAMEKDLISPYWIVTADKERIDSLEKAMTRNFVQTRRWWEFGMHKMDVFKSVPKGALGNTEQISKSYLGLPFHLYLNERDRSRIEMVLQSV